ncbi:MAG TPA: sn-glycerol-3-phosphate ABC transporter ATP-binding protein UgpC [Baekduia sp.]|uniref:ABC transporter ATP-binding protein n=1 Tax=Baekduia sp. TaxID=2600305 RepID=UPI002D78E09F|nr:sn-glycerol-3-phosphate ABC transporter ATP-binding protein UgpC [Baekduia sp.]HET6507992.1 sn-glycerol-3-phosphate ABC transporter ATP-binding protein UgpC [Baekduia sp.]
MAEIQFDGVVKRYPTGNVAVQGLDLTVADGEFMILVGPSGCGKSTALRMVAGLESITDGALNIGGVRVNDVEPARRDVAMVFQSYALYPHLTVRENIAFSLRVAKLKKKEIAARVDEAARLLDLTEYLDRRPAALSGGQRQRVAMGRAIVRRPRAFLMDEPLSNLDAKLRVQMRTGISLLQRRLETTTIFVTHDQTEAMTLGDRLAVMRRGVLQQVGTPSEVYNNPANMFVAGFIGSPAMNFLRATRAGDALELPFGTVALSDEQRRRLDAAAPTGRDVVVGVRPEDLHDAAVDPEPADRPVLALDTTIDLVESLGSEICVFFSLGAETVLRVDDEDTGEDETGRLVAERVTARLAPQSPAREGGRSRLWVDGARLYLFDPGSEACVSAPPSQRREAEVAA